QGHIGQIKKAVQMLSAAKRPVVYFGGGVVLGNASLLIYMQRKFILRHKCAVFFTEKVCLLLA
ncbi:MAG: hypothetical protein II103_06210, partial [Treponema sp.]|nr:hypothetical protein [Treponema sp.]